MVYKRSNKLERLSFASLTSEEKFSLVGSSLDYDKHSSLIGLFVSEKKTFLKARMFVPGKPF
jgi:hypothetical protein